MNPCFKNTGGIVTAASNKENETISTKWFVDPAAESKHESQVRAYTSSCYTRVASRVVTALPYVGYVMCM
jgi:hypothetical protein